ncbi:unnamed protein product [Aureobasidium mustum]|uniref:Uncharacterized protein n=1 Tax=Aureobasidium mustum TaxID=2773714 RepID=A0A9N8PGR1_9PEZI|nr:unnamed protein product [Aureobasidium mustum]
MPSSEERRSSERIAAQKEKAEREEKEKFEREEKARLELEQKDLKARIARGLPEDGSLMFKSFGYKDRPFLVEREEVWRKEEDVRIGSWATKAHWKPKTSILGKNGLKDFAQDRQQEYIAMIKENTSHPSEKLTPWGGPPIIMNINPDLDIPYSNLCYVDLSRPGNPKYEEKKLVLPQPNRDAYGAFEQWRQDMADTEFKGRFLSKQAKDRMYEEPKSKSKAKSGSGSKSSGVTKSHHGGSSSRGGSGRGGRGGGRGGREEEGVGVRAWE